MASDQAGNTGVDAYSNVFRYSMKARANSNCIGEHSKQTRKQIRPSQHGETAYSSFDTRHPGIPASRHADMIPDMRSAWPDH